MEQLSTSGTIELLPDEEWEGILQEPSAKGYLWQASLVGSIATVNLFTSEISRNQNVSPLDKKEPMDPFGPTYPLRVIVKGNIPGTSVLRLTLRKAWDDHAVQHMEIPVVVLHPSP